MITRIGLLAGIFCSVLIILLVCLRSELSNEEKEALTAFSAVQQSLESDQTSVSFRKLLGQAETHFSSLKQAPEIHPCLVNALDRCLASYQLIDRAMKAKQEAADEKRKQELDAALAFSTTLSASSIQQAMDCSK